MLTLFTWYAEHRHFAMKQNSVCQTSMSWRDALREAALGGRRAEAEGSAMDARGTGRSPGSSHPDVENASS